MSSIIADSPPIKSAARSPSASDLRIVADPDPIDLRDAATCLRLANGHRVAARSLQAALASPRFGELTRTIGDVRDKALKREWPVRWADYTTGRDPDAGDLIKRALDAALTIIQAEPDDPNEEPDGPRPYQLKTIGSREFFARAFVRKWLIRGILAFGQPCIVGGPKKALKTTLMVELAICLALALRFLGEFGVPHRRKVLFLSGESGDATIQETARRVCKARGIDPDELEGYVFWGFELPQLSDPTHLAALSEFIEANGIEVVIIDPLYLCLLSGNSRLDPANLFDVGPLLKRVADICLDAGATPILVHHLRKNRDNHDAPPELEDLAFAGVQEFARQWLLIGRREAYEPGTGEHKLWFSVGGSAGHSGCWAVDASEGVVDDDFGGRDWRVSVGTASAVRAGEQEQATAAKAEREAEKRRQAEERKRAEALADTEAALQALRKIGRATRRQLRDALRIHNDRIGAALYQLAEQGRIRAVEIKVRSGRGERTEGGYEVADPTLFGPENRCGSLRLVPVQDPTDTATARAPGVVVQGAPPLSYGEGPLSTATERGASTTDLETDEPFPGRSNKRTRMEQAGGVPS